MSGDRLPDMALSIRQPWAHRILFEGKDIENRQWPTRYRGWFLVHAAKGVDPEDREDVTDDMQRGGVIGMVRLVDCVQHSESKWFHGRFGFVLEDPRPLDFIPCRGALGFFKPDFGGGK